ncbi:MAG: hypothetical protein QM698_17485 [Micropepsaceae bacterium]
MSAFSTGRYPEVFVSHTAISKAVYDAVARGELRRIGTRLYTRNFSENPDRLVRRNWHHLITGYYPDALITDRTALENKPAADGSVFLISEKGTETQLPGLTFRPRQGAAAIDSDRPFIGGARLASTARAYLENMRPSRARGGRATRTLSRGELEQRLDALLRTQGEGSLNKLRDDARVIAPELGLEAEF